MILSLAEIGPADLDELAAWLPAHRWPWHGRPRVDAAWVRERFAAGAFHGEDARAWWLAADGARVGLGRVFELGDPTPLVDLRLAEEARGRGLGRAARGALTARVFAERPGCGRLGGYTRHDNRAMRRVFAACGWTLEAWHRRAWPVAGGEPLDCVGYAILREEAAGGPRRPVPWPERASWPARWASSGCSARRSRAGAAPG